MTPDSLAFVAAYLKARRLHREFLALHRERLAATRWLMARYAVGGLR